MAPPVSRYATWRNILVAALLAGVLAWAVFGAGALRARSTDRFSRT